MPTAIEDCMTMTAVVHHRYDIVPEHAVRLATVPRPTAGPGEVLVRVEAASIDRGTWHIMAGRPYPIRLAGFGFRGPMHTNPGRSFCGTVAAIGPGVTGIARGDAVFGIGLSTLAEYAVAPATKVARRPQHLSVQSAAAMPISGLTAIQAVRDHGRVRRGHQVLVIGGTGGVGSFAVQLAKAAGATVTAMVSAAATGAARRLGADHTLDYGSEALPENHCYDVIIDTAGNRPLAQLRRALAPRGRLVIIGGETGGRWLDGIDRQLRATVMSPFARQSLVMQFPSENSDDLRKLAESGIAPLIDSRYPLGDSAAAIRHLLDGHPRGKIVVNVS
jgi:NADPH:quinone reductase-like Zn-dependent oxidoreductase